jgi:hypothetical protein
LRGGLVVGDDGFKALERSRIAVARLHPNLPQPLCDAAAFVGELPERHRPAAFDNRRRRVVHAMREERGESVGNCVQNFPRSGKNAQRRKKIGRGDCIRESMPI